MKTWTEEVVETPYESEKGMVKRALLIGIYAVFDTTEV